MVLNETFFSSMAPSLAQLSLLIGVTPLVCAFDTSYCSAFSRDILVVHLYNGLANNGTSLHFHGIRQNYTNQNDGVASITQCPLAPGESITYTWRATQYGSSWYHSHFALQGIYLYNSKLSSSH